MTVRPSRAIALYEMWMSSPESAGRTTTAATAATAASAIPKTLILVIEGAYHIGPTCFPLRREVQDPPVSG